MLADPAPRREDGPGDRCLEGHRRRHGRRPSDGPGAHVIAHYGSDRAGAEAATAELPADRVLLVGADLAQPGEVDRLWREALAWRGRIDVLVNNAAMMGSRAASTPRCGLGRGLGRDAAGQRHGAGRSDARRRPPLSSRRAAARRHRLELGGPARLDQSRHHRLRRVEGCGPGRDQDDRAAYAKDGTCSPTSSPRAWCARACPRTSPPPPAARRR